MCVCVREREGKGEKKKIILTLRTGSTVIFRAVVPGLLAAG